MNGITLLAIGNKAYAYWAFNMALSIRYWCDIPIQLVYEPDTIVGLTDWHLDFFDIKTEMRFEDFSTAGRFDPARAKLSINKYTEFDKTLCLDVDAVMMKDPAPIFKLDRYHVQTKGYMAPDAAPPHGVDIWAQPEAIWERFLLSKDTMFPIIETGIQFLTKDDHTSELFMKARQYFNDPIPLDDLKISWGHNQPDELYLGIALAAMNYKPDFPSGIKSLHATYRDKLGSVGDLDREYYCFGLWGNKALNHSKLITYYDRLIQFYSGKWKRNIEFKARALLNHKFVKTNRR